MAETVRKNFVDWAVGILLAICLFLGISEAWRVYRVMTIHSVPAEAFFEPLQLTIPDFTSDIDPVIDYSRQVHSEFVGDWIVEVQLVQPDDSFVAVCTGTGRSIFQPEKEQPATGSNLSWLIGKKCDLSPGTYRVVANWIIERPSATGNVTTRITSNLFKVL